MSMYNIIKTLPGKQYFDLFENLPTGLYNKESFRFKSGHDPVHTHLEGCYVLLKNKEPLGRFAFYENPELKYKNKPAACIGSYECIADKHLSEELLLYAIKLAATKGYKWLIGPMEGSTWNSYRFSNHNRQPNFFMEPYHHNYYNEHFINAGFETIAEYFSNIDQTLDYDKEKLDQFEQYYLSKGAVFRNLNMDDLENDLRKIALFSIEAFSNNFLYTPITTDNFVSKYKKLRQLFDPHLVWIVEDTEGEMQALIFSIKDHFDVSNETLIIKSMARKISSSYRGIGRYLAEKIIQIAKESGYKKVIHALMIKDNASLRISEKYTRQDYKSYTLYGAKL